MDYLELCGRWTCHRIEVPPRKSRGLLLHCWAVQTFKSHCRYVYRIKYNPVWRLSVERPAILILIGETHILDEHHLTILLYSVQRETRVQVVTKLNSVGNSKDFISFDFPTIQILPEETSARNACQPSTTQTVISLLLLPLRGCDAAINLHSLMILLIWRKRTPCLCSRFVFLKSVKSQN